MLHRSGQILGFAGSMMMMMMMMTVIRLLEGVDVGVDCCVKVQRVTIHTGGGQAATAVFVMGCRLTTSVQKCTSVSQ